MARNPDRINKYGLHTSKVNQQLQKLKENTSMYRPDEIARDLVKLALSIDTQAAINTTNAAELAMVDCAD